MWLVLPSWRKGLNLGSAASITCAGFWDGSLGYKYCVGFWYWDFFIILLILLFQNLKKWQAWDPVSFSKRPVVRPHECLSVFQKHLFKRRMAASLQNTPPYYQNSTNAPWMETENPSDSKNTKIGLNQLHGLPPCLLASKNIHELVMSSANSRRRRTIERYDCALSVEHTKDLSASLGSSLLHYTLSHKYQKARFHNTWRVPLFEQQQPSNMLSSPPSLLHYAFPPKTIGCINQGSSSAQTTAALATCCSPLLLRARETFNLYFCKTQTREASKTWWDSVSQNTTGINFMCCFPRLCPEKAAYNSHVRKTQS